MKWYSGIQARAAGGKAKDSYGTFSMVLYRQYRPASPGNYQSIFRFSQFIVTVYRHSFYTLAEHPSPFMSSPTQNHTFTENLNPFNTMRLTIFLRFRFFAGLTVCFKRLLPAMLLFCAMPVAFGLKEQKVWVNLQQSNAEVSNNINLVVPYTNGDVWFLTDNGPYYFNGTSVERVFKNKFRLAGWNITDKVVDDEHLWVISDKGNVGHINMKTQEIAIADTRQSQAVLHVRASRRKIEKESLEGVEGLSGAPEYTYRYGNNLFVITKTGERDILYIVKRFYGRHVDREFKAVQWLEDKDLSGIAADTFGNLWVSSHVNGLYFLPAFFFSAVCHAPEGAGSINTLQALPGKKLLAGSSDGTIFIATISGLDILWEQKLRPAQASSRHEYYPDGENLAIWNRSDYLFGIDNRQRLHGIATLPKESKYLRILPGASITYCKENVVYRIRKGFTETLYVASSIITDICYLPDGDLLIGTTSGLLRYNITHKKITVNYAGINRSVKSIFCASYKFFVFTDAGLSLISASGETLQYKSIADPVQPAACEGVKVIPPYVILFKNIGIQVFDTSFDRSLLTVFTKSTMLNQVIYDADIVNDALLLASKEYGIITMPFNDALHPLPMSIRIADYVFESKTFLDTSQLERHFPLSDTLTYASNADKILRLSVAINKSPTQLLYLTYNIYKAGQEPDPGKWRLIDQTIAFESSMPGTYIVEVRARNDGNEMVYDRKVIRVTGRWYQSRQWQLILLSGTCLIVLVVVIRILFIFRTNKRKQRKAQQHILLLKVASLKNQMNPHFIFNVMNPLQGYILHNKVENALDYLNSFAKVLRKMISHASKDQHSLIDEVDFLDHYLKLQRERFVNKYEFTIDISDIPEPHAVQVPVLVVQPLVENAIEHGFSELNDHLLIEIRFSRQKDLLVVAVKDNGKGFNPDLLFRQGHGLSIIRERLELMYTRSGTRGAFKIERVQDVTIATAYIPL